MVLRVLEAEALAEAALPVAALAAQMRLPDGWDTVPGQRDRLVARLRAAIVGLERKLAMVTVAREVTLTGPGGAERVAMPIWPDVSIVSVEAVTEGVATAIAGARIEEDGPRTKLVLPRAPSEAARLRVVVRAGFGAWEDVPAPLAQAALMEAEALETGERQAAPVAALIGPWRAMRIGAAG
jgi:hypothetical protein